MKSPRSLNAISFGYDFRTPQGQKIMQWILKQECVAESVKELICEFGDQYNQWKADHPRPRKISFYQRRRLAGLCVRCGKEAHGKSRCLECLAKIRKTK